MHTNSHELSAGFEDYGTWAGVWIIPTNLVNSVMDSARLTTAYVARVETSSRWRGAIARPPRPLPGIFEFVSIRVHSWLRCTCDPECF